jgi:hypothetical protein
LDGLPANPGYHLPLLPSEYMQRHVRVSATVGLIACGSESLSLTDAMDALPDPDMIVFATDCPHVEGREDSKEHFERLLPNDTKLRERFFGGSMEDFLVEF